jgi:hypothetical protein
MVKCPYFLHIFFGHNNACSLRQKKLYFVAAQPNVRKFEVYNTEMDISPTYARE